MREEIEIRECVSPGELSGCVRLQRAVFNLPEVEISPVRHLIVTRHAGGFTLGAFHDEKMVGFVLSVTAFRGNEKIFYSHMTAVDKDYQNYGIGSGLKWAQRKRALKEGVKLIKWTFQPVQARNAFFNLEKLGAIVREYQSNFYGTDYAANKTIGIPSDRLFAEWEIDSERVEKLSAGEFDEQPETSKISVTTLNDWNTLVTESPEKAIAEQARIRSEFDEAFAQNLVCTRFRRSAEKPEFLFY